MCFLVVADHFGDILEAPLVGRTAKFQALPLNFYDSCTTNKSMVTKKRTQLEISFDSWKLD